MLTHIIRICIIGMATKARHCKLLRPRVPRKPALALFSMSLRNVWAEICGEVCSIPTKTARKRFEVGNDRCLAHSEWWFRMIAIRTSQHSAGALIDARSWRTPYGRQAPRTRPMCWIAVNWGTRRMRGPTVPDRSFSVPGRSRCGRNAHRRGRSPPKGLAKRRMRDI